MSTPHQSMQRAPTAGHDQRDSGSERTTLLIAGAIVVGVLLLIGLVAALTLFPSQMLSHTYAGQLGVQREQTIVSFTRQTESFFNAVANDLLSVAGRNTVQSVMPGSYGIARVLIMELASRHVGQIKGIVRVDKSGVPVYGWPDDLNDTISAGKALPWRIDAGIMKPIREVGGVQFVRRTVNGSPTYLLVAPVTVSGGEVEGLAVELDLSMFFAQNMEALALSPTTQIWVFDPTDNQVVYQRLPDLKWPTSTTQSVTAKTIMTQAGAPTTDRDMVVGPIFTALGSTAGDTPSLVAAIAWISIEGQSEIYTTQRNLFFGGLVVVLLIMVMGGLFARYVFIEANTRRQDNQRRATVRTLLEMSRTLNSSLDLPVVLSKILDELDALMPHDSASVMLLDGEASDEQKVRVAAQRGDDDVIESEFVSLRKVRGTREVVRSGKAVTINDTRNDPRWNATIGGSTIASWMGVPLRLRDQAVGVLNINSSQPNRFGPADAELAEAFADQACVAIENARAHELQIRSYENELETAHAIQTSLLPTEMPPLPQLQISAQSLPARHVSGDYYQYLPLPDGRLGIAVGDVSGKGIPAALLMAVITTSLRDEVLRYPSPAPLLNQLNLNLLDRMQSNHMNSALLVAIFSPTTRHIELANAGMVQPYVRMENGWEFVPVGGYPLGASIRASYNAKTLTLAPGALLLFISDGVIEAQNAAGEFFGFERLEALLNETALDISADALVDCILTAVRAHLGGLEAQDDMTVVALKSVEV